MSQKVDIIIDVDADFVLNITLNDVNGDPINITGYTFAATLKDNYSDPSVTLDFSCNIVTALDGTLTVALTHTQTSTIPIEPAASVKLTPTQYCWDCLMTDAGGFVTKIMEGYAFVRPTVTV